MFCSFFYRFVVNKVLCVRIIRLKSHYFDICAFVVELLYRWLYN